VRPGGARRPFLPSPRQDPGSVKDRGSAERCQGRLRKYQAIRPRHERPWDRHGLAPRGPDIPRRRSWWHLCNRLQASARD